jgi:hypothetical protein
MDFTFTRRVGVMGEFAAFRGLKLRMESMILLAIDCRVRIRTARQLKVALTRIASLVLLVYVRYALVRECILRVILKNGQEPIEET